MKETEYIVNFFGEKTHANLPRDKIAKFTKEFEIHSKTKKKSLLNSIKQAELLCNENIPIYEKEIEIRENIIHIRNVKLNDNKEDIENKTTPKKRISIRKITSPKKDESEEFLCMKRIRPESKFRFI
jgi:hypothetical protein